MTKMNLEPEAKALYLNGKPLRQIAKQLGITEQTLIAWKSKFKWEQEAEERKKLTNEETKRNFEKFRKGIATAGTNLFMKMFQMLNEQLDNGRTLRTDDVVKIGKLVEEITRPVQNVYIGDIKKEVLTSEDFVNAGLQGLKDGEKRNNKKTI